MRTSCEYSTLLCSRVEGTWMSKTNASLEGACLRDPSTRLCRRTNVASFRRVGVGPGNRPSPGYGVSAHQPPRPALKNSKLSVAERGACCGSPSVVKLRPLRNRASFSGATFIRAAQMSYLPHSFQQRVCGTSNGRRVPCTTTRDTPRVGFRKNRRRSEFKVT